MGGGGGGGTQHRLGPLEDHDSVTCGRPAIGPTSCTGAYKRKVRGEGTAPASRNRSDGLLVGTALRFLVQFW